MQLGHLALTCKGWWLGRIWVSRALLLVWYVTLPAASSKGVRPGKHACLPISFTPDVSMQLRFLMISHNTPQYSIAQRANAQRNTSHKQACWIWMSTYTLYALVHIPCALVHYACSDKGHRCIMHQCCRRLQAKQTTLHQKHSQPEPPCNLSSNHIGIHACMPG